MASELKLRKSRNREKRKLQKNFPFVIRLETYIETIFH